MINPKFRDYHLPSFADIPRTEVFFADTFDTVGPMGAKSMSESPYNPVAAALGNALADATGIRFTATPVQAGPAVAGAAGEVREVEAVSHHRHCGSVATRQSILLCEARWIASLRSQ